ncbi:hypothetical protein [Sulfuricurvum sp.]|uniref:hypothetical protein n=1 Tax=Sulfuricurvum sp. TaxID=2025608 RepID=UPI003BAF3930
MKSRLQLILNRIFQSVMIVSSVSFTAGAETDIAILTQEKAKLDLEVAIEKNKADIAEYKKTQHEAEMLSDLTIKQKEAEAKKAEAEAEKGEALAKIPPTKIEALSGSLDIKNFGSAGLIVAVDVAKSLAPSICKVIDDNETALIYDAQTFANITSANFLSLQLELYQKALSNSLKEVDSNIGKRFLSEIGMGAVVATGTAKAVADLASLFKTNITVTKTDFPEAKSLLLTAMASNCPKKLISLGIGYSGELDTTEFMSLRDKALKLIGDRGRLDVRLSEIKKRLEKEKDPAKKKLLQTQYDDLAAVGKLVDGFIAIIKPNEISDKSPLPIAAKFLALAKRSANSKILDIDLKLEGLSIVKENIFTGQHLRLSATAIAWYRLQDRSGEIIKAGVLRKIEKPVQIDLRGNDAEDSFWSKE